MPKEPVEPGPPSTGDVKPAHDAEPKPSPAKPESADFDIKTAIEDLKKRTPPGI